MSSLQESACGAAEAAFLSFSPAVVLGVVLQSVALTAWSRNEDRAHGSRKAIPGTVHRQNPLPR